MAQGVKNQTSIHEDTGLIPGLAQCLKIQCCCELGVGRRCGFEDWILCCCGCGRLAGAAPVQPLAWEHPFGMGEALKSKKKTKTKKQKTFWKSKGQGERNGVPHLTLPRIIFHFGRLNTRVRSEEHEL